jgi:hypothetical protein
VEFSFDATQNALVLSCNNIHGEISGSFKQRLLLISATGKFRAVFKDGGVSFKVAFPVST